MPEAKLDRLATCYGRTSSPASSRPGRGAGRLAARPPRFESGAGGLVSTVDDLLAFGRMMLKNGAPASAHPLAAIGRADDARTTSRRSRRRLSPFFPNFWDTRGWGFGVAIITARDDMADVPGRFGWDGGFGTSWYVDPKEGLIGILMTQRRPDRLALPPVVLDFWTSVYQLIDD